MTRTATLRATALLVLGGLACSIALAQSAVDCSNVADDKSRLKCYDDQAKRQKMKAVVPTEPAAAPVAAVPALPAAVAPAAAHAPSQPPAPSSAYTTPDPGEFGLTPDVARRNREARHPDAPKEADQIVVRVKGVTTRAHGEYLITMEDGNVWQEMEYSGNQPPQVGESVTIKRAMMGSFFLSRTKGTGLRVKRVQ